MSIQRKPKAADTKANEFIAGAPDASVPVPDSYDKGIRKGNKRQISLTIAPDLLRKVDEAARELVRVAQASSTWRFIVLSKETSSPAR